MRFISAARTEEASVTMDLSGGVQYKPVEQRISIESDVQSKVINKPDANEGGKTLAKSSKKLFHCSLVFSKTSWY